jgi:ornithine carbamoyltransferase
MKNTKRDLIDFLNYTKAELEEILQLAQQIKSKQLNVSDDLQGKTIGLLFSVASTRTRVSFQAGIKQMGGSGEYLNSNDLQLSNNESLRDTAQVLNRYLDGLVVRMYNMNEYGKGRDALNLIAENTNIPVINGLDDKAHPCQILADLLTMKEKFGEGYKKKKVVMTWGYSKRQKSPGVLHSMMTAGALLGMDITFAYPKNFDLDEKYVHFAKEQLKQAGGSLNFSNDLMEASEGADVIYVKNWKACYLSTEEDMNIRTAVKDKWCIGEEHFKKANPGAVYMDCLPLVRGEQVTAEVADGPRSIIYDEAENRLHAQKAILKYLMQRA